MARLLTPVLFLLFACYSVAQVSQFAPQIRQDAETWIGFANPGKTELSVTITGYNDLGEEVGTEVVALKKFARYEASAKTLFGADVAWAKIDTSIALPAYVRYAQNNGKISLVEMSHLSGDDLYVAQVTSSKENCGQEVALVNTTAAEGQVLSQPIWQRARCDREPKLRDEPVVVNGISKPYESTVYNYLDQEKENTQFFWDVLRTTNADMKIAGVQHIGVCDENGGHFASMTLPRTTNRSMMFPNIGAGGTETWTKIVLANTFDRDLKVRIRALYDPFILPYFEATQTEYIFEFAPFEKREFMLNRPNALGELTSNATWYEVTPFEGGLIGYLLTGSDSGQLAASDANDVPSSIQVMPFTPTSDAMTTEISVVNVKNVHAEGYLIGFNDEGRMVARNYNMHILPNESVTFTLEEVFGEKAREVTWSRFAAHNGDITAYALVRKRDGSDFALMHATSVGDQNGEIFFADFEHFSIDEMNLQGWTPYSFGDLTLGNPTELGYRVYSPGRAISAQLLSRLDVNFDSAFMGWHVWVTSRRSSEFFTETVVPAKTGVFYVGYEPSYASFDQDQFQFSPDREALLSPFFEVPNYGEWYFHFDMRFINPQWATDKSRYGIVWREEGSDQWTWVGATGELMLYPTALVADCWLDIVYRYAEGVMTGWIPFGSKIPVKNNGKRIQVGIFYLQDNDDAERFGGPLIFVDNIQLKATPRSFMAHYGVHSEGTFQYAPPAEEGDKAETQE